MSLGMEENEHMTSSEGKEIFRRIRPASWPAPPNTNITVTAKEDAGEWVSIFWESDDLVAKGVHPTQATLTADEFRAIAIANAAVA